MFQFSFRQGLTELQKIEENHFENGKLYKKVVKNMKYKRTKNMWGKTVFLFKSNGLLKCANIFFFKKWLF